MPSAIVFLRPLGLRLRHSEFNPSRDEAVHLLQIWIQPDRKGLTPRYAEKSLSRAAKGRLNLVASKSGRDGSLSINQEADLYLAKLEAGNEVSHQLKAGRHAWVHVAEGEVKVNGGTLKDGDAMGLSDQAEIGLVGAKPSQVLLFDLN